MASGPARVITIYSPLGRADLPGLYARVCRGLEAQAGAPVVCDVNGLSADAVVVEALCRLQLGARHWGCAVRLRRASPELIDLVAFLGLGDVIRPESAVEV